MAYTGISAGQPIKASDVTNALDSKADKTTVDDIGISIDDIYAAIGVLDFFPVGAILIFSGSAYSSASAAFKQKWKICNGKSGTPDLVNKFLRGAESSGSAAGADSQSITLQTANLPSHNHTQSGTFTSGNNSVGHAHLVTAAGSISGGAHDHSITDPGHTHATHWGSGWPKGGGSWGGAEYGGSEATAKSTTGITVNSASHSHTFSGSTVTSGGVSANHTHSVTLSGNTGSAGSGTAFTVNTVPGYYTVIYIIKVA